VIKGSSLSSYLRIGYSVGNLVISKFIIFISFLIKLVLINKNPLTLILAKLIILIIIPFFNIVYGIIRLFLSTSLLKSILYKTSIYPKGETFPRVPLFPSSPNLSSS
jgi:hypothetical protein